MGGRLCRFSKGFISGEFRALRPMPRVRCERGALVARSYSEEDMRTWWMASVLLGVSALALGCGTASPGEGASCSTSNPCLTGLACVNDAAGASRCMRQCTRGSSVCSDGLACVDLTSAGAVCWLGGATSIGSPCSGGSQCERGGVCVTPMAGAAAVCAQACSPPSAEFCAMGESCVATTGGGGFCRSGS